MRMSNDPDGGNAMWLMLVPHLICCGGAAVLLLVSGAGIAGAGVVRASFGLLILGFIVFAVALVWRGRRSRRGAS